MNRTTSGNRITYARAENYTAPVCIILLENWSGFVVHTAAGTRRKRPGATPEQKI